MKSNITREELSSEAAKTAQKIKDKFPAISDADCGAWGKFIVASAKCINDLGAQHAERVLEECGKRFLVGK